MMSGGKPLFLTCSFFLSALGKNKSGRGACPRSPLLQGFYRKAVEFTPHRIDVREGQRVSVRAVREQDEDAPVAWVDPNAGAGEAVVPEAVRR
jgi:hypothetical protein